LNGCLLSIVTALFFLNFYSQTLFARPTSFHQWRQTDCLSTTKNYFEEGMHFFSPKIHSLNAPGGRAVSECPLMNYSVAFLWKLFGEHEYIYRLLEYFIYLLAIFTLFNTLSHFFKQYVLSFFIVSVLLTSPLLVFYSFNFLSDVPALSFNVMCFCFLFSYHRTKFTYYFILSVLAGTLAVLLKLSALVGLSILVIFALFDFFKTIRANSLSIAIKQNILVFVSIAASLILVKSWYDFALRYNTFDNGVFLLTVLPIWDMRDSVIFENLKLLSNNLFPVFLNRPMLALFFAAVVYVIFNFGKLDEFLKISFLLVFSFFVLYILIFFQVLTVHDYYLVNLFIFPVITSFCLVSIISQTAYFHSAFSLSILIITFVFNAYYSAVFYRLRMIKNDNFLTWYPFCSREELQAAEYQHWDYERTIEPLEDIRPQLRILGIQRTDRFLCVPDNSPNIALYFIDQKGYTISSARAISDSNCIKRYLVKKVKYLLILDQNLKNEKCFQSVSGSLKSIFKKSHVEIFKMIN
jgi:hypothetical protein